MKIQPVYTISMVQSAEKDLPILVLYTKLEDLMYLKSGLDAEYFYSGMTCNEYDRIVHNWFGKQTRILLVHANKFWMYESPLGDGTEPVVLWYKPDTESAVYQQICGK